MRRFLHQFKHLPRRQSTAAAMTRPEPEPQPAAGVVARGGRSHRWARRFAPPPALTGRRTQVPRPLAPLTGIQYMAMPDADTRDALEALVNAWRQAADAFGESMLQYAERCLFEGRQAPLQVVDAPFAVRAVSNDEMRQFQKPIVRIEVRAPDTLAGLEALMLRWSVLADGQAWDFIEIGCRRMLHGA
jgi:hypothetical protein